MSVIVARRSWSPLVAAAVGKMETEDDITQEDAWDVITCYFKEKGLVRTALPLPSSGQAERSPHLATHLSYPLRRSANSSTPSMSSFRTQCRSSCKVCHFLPFDGSKAVSRRLRVQTRRRLKSSRTGSSCLEKTLRCAGQMCTLLNLGRST